jgi:hypothetical protein
LRMLKNELTSGEIVPVTGPAEHATPPVAPGSAAAGRRTRRSPRWLFCHPRQRARVR